MIWAETTNEKNDKYDYIKSEISIEVSLPYVRFRSKEQT